MPRAAYAACSALLRVTSSRVSTGTGARNVLMPGQPAKASSSTSLSLSSGASLVTRRLIVTCGTPMSARRRSYARARRTPCVRPPRSRRRRPQAWPRRRRTPRRSSDRAGEQKFERARRAILSAHMRRLADDEFEATPLALDELVELTDRRHLDLDEALRSLGRRLVWVSAVAALARVGDLFQRGKA